MNPFFANFCITALENINGVKLPTKTKENDDKRSRDNYTSTGNKKIRCHKCSAEFINVIREFIWSILAFASTFLLDRLSGRCVTIVNAPIMKYP